MEYKRGSGILLHISSLPSPFGIGDLGEEACDFVDFLAESGYKYWQVLPMNPTEEAFGFSPYSSHSAFAGNQLFISPVSLVKDGYLKEDEVVGLKVDTNKNADFQIACKNKKHMLDLAHSRFKIEKEKEAYHEFCSDNEIWLADFALYMSIRSVYPKVWSEWPKALRDRDKEALYKFRQEYAEEIEREKFFQYIFFKQLNRLRIHARLKNISLIGDIPFYINHDSADCWIEPANFKLNGRKTPEKVAGVPPDYFSETGQLWGFPIYNWENMAKDGYGWWMSRLEQNLRMYEIVRLDHFRAFSAFWEVDSGEETAINGEWIDGPGVEFFKIAKEKFPDMPFISEDLGTLDEAIYSLIDEVGLPGMRVLQFAFDKDMAENTHIIHRHDPNSIVFTGTHDNNTTVGWYKGLDRRDRKRFSDYVGKRVTKQNAHHVLHQLALMSVARIAIIPMQDILGLDEDCVMNRPSSAGGNWGWRMTVEQMKSLPSKRLKKMNAMYGRI
jgi:4-alpha-glucanotransferase